MRLSVALQCRFDAVGLACSAGTHHFSVDRTGAYRQHPYTLRGIIKRHLPGQRENATFARGICRHTSLRLQPLDAGGVDDGAAATASDLWQGVLAHQEVTLQVDVENSVPHLLRRVLGVSVRLLR